MTSHIQSHFKEYTYDMFMMCLSAQPEEMDDFSEWMDTSIAHKLNSFEAVHDGPAAPKVTATRLSGEPLSMVNFATYNYLGLSYHPEVKAAAKAAIDQYGIGAASSPLLSGTLKIHKELESALLRHFDLPNRSASLFSSGYGVNLGTIQAFMKPKSIILLDEAAHVSIIEGAKLSGADIKFFKHNDMDHLSALIRDIDCESRRTLICAEGIYSADGDEGRLADIVDIAKKNHAFTLVDEAHSVFLSGKNGRGVAEAQGVLNDIDLFVMTFSKALGGVGGAVIARTPIARYINWYASCRSFSCAMDPAVAGGLTQSITIASGPEGQERRARLRHNVEYLRSKLSGKLDLGISNSWITTVLYGADKKTADISTYLHLNGLDGSILQFPAVPKDKGRIRLFLSSEHTTEDLDQASDILLKAAKQFDFYHG